MSPSGRLGEMRIGVIIGEMRKDEGDEKKNYTPDWGNKVQKGQKETRQKIPSGFVKKINVSFNLRMHNNLPTTSYLSYSILKALLYTLSDKSQGYYWAFSFLGLMREMRKDEGDEKKKLYS